MIEPHEIAERFQLGSATSALEHVTGGNTHRLYRLTSADGIWAVKVLNRTFEPWWLESFEQGVRLEAAAIEAGVNAPRPALPDNPVAGVIAEFPTDDGTVVSVRVHEWIDGGAPSFPADNALCEWLGTTMATIGGLQLGADDSGASAHQLHSMDEWDSWIAEAANLDCGTALTEARSLIERARELASAVENMGLPVQLLHRDVNQRNVLDSPRGPMLLDWDSAGAAVPWLDFIGSVWRFSGFPQQALDSHAVAVAIAAYQRHGGIAGMTDATAFAGLLRSDLNALAFFLWRALGHRPVTETERQASEQLVSWVITELEIVMKSLHEWTAILARAT